MNGDGGRFKHLGKALLVLRLVKGLSQAELADRSGIRSNQISRYETGQVQPQLPRLERILEGLGVGLPELFFAMTQIERLATHLEDAQRSPAETLARDAVAAYWADVTDQHLKISRAVTRALQEQLGGGPTEKPTGGKE